MSIELRIDVLKQINYLTQDEAEKILLWISVLKDTFNITLTEENGSTLITHLSSMLKRSKEEDVITAMDPSIYDQLKELDVFEQAMDIYRQLNLSFNIPKEEEDYVLLHICTLLQQEVNK